MLNFEDTVARAHDSVVGVLSTRDLIRASGPDAKSFLQGQLSQDLERLRPGTTLESLVLSPQGRLDAYVRVIVFDDDSLALDLDSGYGAALLDRLRRFKLRVKVELSLVSVDYLCLRGPKAVEIGAPYLSDAVATFGYEWPGLVGLDIGGVSFSSVSSVEEGDPAALELLRIKAGQPGMGSELTEKTIAQETALTSRTVSFTKGCFTGQELVARIDARGSNVARHLRLLVVQPGERHRVPYVGEPVMVADREVGTLTSTAFSPLENCSYALSFIHRSIEVPASAVVVAGGGEDLLETQIKELPERD